MKRTYKEILLCDAFWFQEGPGVRRWQFKDQGIKLLNVKNILKTGKLDLLNTDRYLDTKEVTSKYNHFLVDEGDLVIASSGISIDEDGFLRTRGAFVHKNHLPLCMNTSTIRFKANKGVSSLSFLKHWIDSYEFRVQITREVTGIAQKNFGPSHLKRLKISLPPLEEQKRIAAILDKADALRQKRQHAIAKLDELLQSVFLDMFGDPVTNPKGWQLMKCKDICKQISVGIVVKPASYYVKEGVPAFRSLNIKRNKISLDNLVYVSVEDNNSKLLKSQVKKGDVLIVRSGQPGTAAVVDKMLDGSNTIDIIISRPNQEHIVPHYFSHFLNSQGGKQIVLSNQKGQIQKHLNVSSLSNALIPVPDLNIQKYFLDIRNQIIQVETSIEKSLERIDTLFSSLQQRAFNGEL